MARVIVKGPWQAEVEITTDPETTHLELICRSDRCSFAAVETYSTDDALEAATIHVDYNCPARFPSWHTDKEDEK